MNYQNYKRAKDKKEELKKQVLEIFPSCPDACGIYILTREEKDKNGEIVKKVGYVGQSLHILTRIAEHLIGWQWIDCSLKKWGLFTETNKSGYSLWTFLYPKEQLDEAERKYIEILQNKGYELRNQTTGGQDEGKQKLGEWKPPKTYRDGLTQGFRNCQKYVATMFDKYLDFTEKQPETKLTNRKKDEFIEFLRGNYD